MAELYPFTQNLYLFEEDTTQPDDGVSVLVFSNPKVRTANTTAQRLNVAHTLLASSDLPIGDIAQQCGFSSASHLIRTFRKKHGTTPAKWRKIQRRGRVIEN